MGVALFHRFPEEWVVLDGGTDLEHVVYLVSDLLVDYFFEIVQFSDCLIFEIQSHLPACTYN